MLPSARPALCCPTPGLRCVPTPGLRAIRLEIVVAQPELWLLVYYKDENPIKP